jgi:hypothetical protein
MSGESKVIDEGAAGCDARESRLQSGYILRLSRYRGRRYQWRRTQPVPPSRAAAIRYLIERGFESIEHAANPEKPKA